jgi:hypothetical protein
MPFTSDQISEIRNGWILWDPPSDADLVARSDILGSDSIYPVVIEQLRKALISLASPSSPAQFTIVGDYGQNTGKNIDALRDLLTDATTAWESEQTALTGNVSQLVRRDHARGGWYGPTPATGW